MVISVAWWQQWIVRAVPASTRWSLVSVLSLDIVSRNTSNPFEESKIQCSNKTTSRILKQRVMSAAGKKKKKKADEEAAEVSYY